MAYTCIALYLRQNASLYIQPFTHSDPLTEGRLPYTGATGPSDHRLQ